MAELNFTLKIISRKQAKSEGLKRYFTGKPCPHGHVCERFVSAGQCFECLAISRNSWYEKNKEKSREKNKTWHKNNRNKKRIINARYRAKNLEKVKDSIKNHYLLFPEKYTEYRNNRRARLKNAPGNGIPSKFIKELIEKQSGLCVYCKEKKPLTLDHIVPLASGGLHDISNAQMVCKSCNSSKGKKDPFDFAKSRGMLF